MNRYLSRQTFQWPPKCLKIAYAKNIGAQGNAKKALENMFSELLNTSDCDDRQLRGLLDLIYITQTKADIFSPQDICFALWVGIRYQTVRHVGLLTPKIH